MGVGKDGVGSLTRYQSRKQYSQVILAPYENPVPLGSLRETGHSCTKTSRAELDRCLCLWNPQCVKSLDIVHYSRAIVVVAAA